MEIIKLYNAIETRYQSRMNSLILKEMIEMFPNLSVNDAYLRCTDFHREELENEDE